jgi:hypothetical protein
MKLNPEHAERIRHALAGGAWIGRRLLATIARVPERSIRLFAEQTGEVISSQRGYKLKSRATDVEMVESARDLESRARHLLDRAASIRAHMNGDSRTGDLFT